MAAPPRPEKSRLRSMSTLSRKKSEDNMSLLSEHSTSGFTSDGSMSTAATSFANHSRAGSITNQWLPPPRSKSLLTRNVSTTRSEVSDDGLEQIANSVVASDSFRRDHWNFIERTVLGSGKPALANQDEIEETASDCSGDSDPDPSHSRRNSDSSSRSAQTSFSWIQLPHHAAIERQALQERLKSTLLLSAPRELAEETISSRRSSASAYAASDVESTHTLMIAAPEAVPLPTAKDRWSSASSSSGDLNGVKVAESARTSEDEEPNLSGGNGEDGSSSDVESEFDEDELSLQELKFQGHLSAALSPTQVQPHISDWQDASPLHSSAFPLGSNQPSLLLTESNGMDHDLFTPLRESLGKDSNWLAPPTQADLSDKVASLLMLRNQSSAGLEGTNRDSYFGPESQFPSRTGSPAFKSKRNSRQFTASPTATRSTKRASLLGHSRSNVSLAQSRRASYRRSISPFPLDNNLTDVPLIVIDRKKYKRFSGSYRAMYFTDRRTTRDWLGLRGKGIEKPKNCLSKKLFEKSYNSALWSGNQRTVDIISYEQDVPLIKTKAWRNSKASQRNSQRNSSVPAFAPQLSLAFQSTLPQIPEDYASQVKFPTKPKRGKRKSKHNSVQSNVSSTQPCMPPPQMMAPMPLHPIQLQQMQMQASGIPFNFYHPFAPPMPSAPSSNVSGSGISKSRSGVSAPKSAISNTRSNMSLTAKTAISTGGKSTISYASRSGSTMAMSELGPRPTQDNSSPWTAPQQRGAVKRTPGDLSIQVPSRSAKVAQSPMTSVPRQRERPPSGGLKSAKPKLVSTPFAERHPIVTPALPSEILSGMPSAVGTISEEKKNGMFSKLFKKRK